MNSSPNNFGPRLRRLIEQRGTVQEAYLGMGIAKGTLHNWLALDSLDEKSPKIRSNIESKIRAYFGPEAEEVLSPARGLLAEQEAAYDAQGRSPAEGGASAGLRAQIEQKHREELAAAGDDVARLGWLLIQHQSHLTPPPAWAAERAAVAIVRAPANQQQPAQPASGRVGKVAS